MSLLPSSSRSSLLLLEVVATTAPGCGDGEVKCQPGAVACPSVLLKDASGAVAACTMQPIDNFLPHKRPSINPRRLPEILVVS
ncbi:hypothetical protein R3P38DRAFT_3186187 [Favolaschia claudopus]|uniref:Secreted protein n=1 Tax=Favolaschia claudopus TaxID=2862362 RepID=A0AAW0C4V6_9AGAR